MPPAAVEIASPIEKISSFPNPVRDFTTFVQGSCHSHDQRSMDPSSFFSASGMGNGSAFGLGAGSGPRAKNRARPRLVKLRKHGGKVRGADPGETLSGFNPFASSGTSGNGGVQVVDNINGELNGNGCFVFGANGIRCAASTSLDNAQMDSLCSDDVSDKDKCSRPVGDSCFGFEFRKEHPDGDFAKPGCNNQENNRTCGENGFCGVETTLRSESGDNRSRENSTFVFGSSSKNSNNVEENSGGCNGRTKTPGSKLCSDTGGKFYCTQSEDGKATDYSQVPVLNLHDGMKNLNISDAEEPNETSSKPAFVFGSFGNVNVENNEATMPSGSCSFRSNGFHPNDDDDDAAEGQPNSHAKNSNGNFSTSTTFGTSTSSSNFKVPQWDPSSLKTSLFPETSRNRVVIGGNRLSKQRRSKKVREKLKQSKQNLTQDLASDEFDSQEKFNSPGYSSPMDFSPYDDSKASGQYPPEAPSTTSNLSGVGVQEDSGFSNDVNVAFARDAFTFSTEDRESNCMPAFPFSSGLGDEKGFTFSVSTSHGKVPLRKHQTQKKFRRKVNKNLLKNDPTAQSKQEARSENEVQAKQDTESTSLMPDACETWRLRGNQAYRTGDLLKAEDCYTQGIKSIPPSASSESSVKSLALCHGNRAAARISLGRLREAIRDCEMAASLDRNFIKAYMRAANCHLVLGELAEAVQYFNKCLETASSVCLDRRTTIEAAEGLQKAQRVTDCTNRATELLEKRTPGEALGPIAEALSISSCSVKLLRMKAEALFMVQRYKQVIELCEHTLHVAEMNSASAGSMDCSTSPDNLGSVHLSREKVWGWNLISKSHFCIGNLETALDILQKLQQVEPSCNKNQDGVFDSPACLKSTISELLHFKNAGNEAVRAGRYSEAIEHYTAALSRSVESRPFAAICFCNRAAANQALVQIADAIADCSLAMALDTNYTKAIFRRATLNEMIRDYDQAASDLRRLIDVLEKKCGREAKSSERSAGSASSIKELKQARERLSAMEDELRKGIPLDFFLILGVKKSDTATDIKKAYRKAALRHHPDKVGQILVRGESEGQWLKEIIHEVHKDADRLFKIIGEAYSVLSDPTKRSEYEAEEETRKARASREGSRSRGNRKPDFSSERSPNRRNWRDSRRNNGNMPEWW